MKALNSTKRLHYPKVAAHSRLDDLLARRIQLKVCYYFCIIKTMDYI